MQNKKNIVFLNPPLNLNGRYGILSQAGAVEPPLGLAYLAATIRESKLETKIIDAQALGLGIEETVRIILSESPDFLAVTLPTVALNNAVRLCRKVKQINPSIIVIAGGNHFSALPQETLRENPCFDLGVIGEGEETLKILLDKLLNSGSLHEVPGIAFRCKGEIIVNAPSQRIRNLDQLPMPAFDLLPQLSRYYRPVAQSIKYLPAVSLVTSRGCLGKCTFCDRKTFGNEISSHSAEYIADMLEKLSKDFGIKGIIFEDDNFMLSEDRLACLAKLINKRKIKVSWAAMSRIDTISVEKLKLAKSCGCWQVLYGIESGSQKILNSFHKGITVSEIKKTVVLTKKSGLSVKGFFVIGSFLETRETLEETRKLIMELPFNDVSVTYFTPYPGAEVWGNITDFGSFNQNWDKLTCFDLVLIPQGLNKEEIISYQSRVYKDFYSRIKIIYSYLMRLRSFSQFRILYRSYLSLKKQVRSGQNRKTLIINADDFGLCEGINQGISMLLKKDILEGVSIMPTGYAFEGAVRIAKQYPKIKVGAHLSLLGEGCSVLQKNEIPSLVNKTGNFEKTFYVFLARFLLGRIKKKEIEKEFQAQIQKISQAGLEITHLDSHQHIHMVPGIFGIILKLSKEKDIHFVRLPCVPLGKGYFFSKAKLSRKLYQLILNLLCLIYKGVLKRNNIGFMEHSYGFLESGHLDSNNLRQIFANLKKGPCELITHPAQEDGNLRSMIGYWKYGWQQELETLSSDSLKDLLDNFGIKFAGFYGNN